MVQSNQGNDSPALTTGQASVTDAQTGNPLRTSAPQPINIAEVFTHLPPGSKVKMRDGVIGEVTANPEDGGWIFIRYVEHPKDPSKVGEEDMVFCVDVVGVVETAS